ncbi:TIGR00251 family protein [Bartonella bacilliformis str. Heidi Mejia]|uniref:UPF0235 protein BARBAKC583_0328 n=3 Tax=Bartonella bacilliformis TaxID=774 RepID=A1URP5_BARBK|nr:DUF167 family protein [Bartonella bacilliformis]ABM45193.1 conserved hypothetical protein TIGR00251 [Bartonella bacilliformis KC583]AMG85497.1 DUF167 domain-containing protein [Bartonella bacilliformis]EKS45766.1 hypothetical protein BbINS_01513 [Bartonella bacilliformis INS]EYS90216.1 TIGR00251 family protein [Bartonella bacilliformis San Pedro600-02]EYS92380.1 TIGR00251 family protein [Bartonella bacilliformis str. Heidi Mejia]
MFYRVDVDSLILFVRLTPKASMNNIVGVESRDDGKQYLIIRLCAVPEDGKANKALIKFLAKQWKIPSSCISLENGAISRYKQLRFSGGVEKIEKILHSLGNYTPART